MAMRKNGFTSNMSLQRKLESSTRKGDPSIRWDDRKRGFTLIELSIVLVVIGLVAGGVLFGMDLIRQAKYREHISDVSKIKLAVIAFKTEYSAYPGDFKNASTFWPSANNGNGDKHADANLWYAETVYFWQHLSLAGLIEGSYTGDWAPGVMVGEEIPPSGLGDGLGWFIYYSTNPGGGYHGHYPVGHYVTVARDSGPTQYYPTWNNTLLGEEVMLIDQKVDDGFPLTGIVLTWDHWACENGGVYETSVTNNYCWFVHSIE